MARRTELRTRRGGLANEVDELAAALHTIEAYDATTAQNAAKAAAAAAVDPLGQLVSVDEWGEEDEWGDWLDGFVVEASKAAGEAGADPPGSPCRTAPGPGPRTVSYHAAALLWQHMLEPWVRVRGRKLGSVLRTRCAGVGRRRGPPVALRWLHLAFLPTMCSMQTRLLQRKARRARAAMASQWAAALMWTAATRRTRSCMLAAWAPAQGHRHPYRSRGRLWLAAGAALAQPPLLRRTGGRSARTARRCVRCRACG